MTQHLLLLLFAYKVEMQSIIKYIHLKGKTVCAVARSSPFNFNENASILTNKHQKGRAAINTDTHVPYVLKLF